MMVVMVLMVLLSVRAHCHTYTHITLRHCDVIRVRTMPDVNAAHTPLTHCSLVLRCCEASWQEGGKPSWGFRLRYINSSLNFLLCRHCAICGNFDLQTTYIPTSPVHPEGHFVLHHSTSRRLASINSDGIHRDFKQNPHHTHPP